MWSDGPPQLFSEFVQQVAYLGQKCLHANMWLQEQGSLLTKAIRERASAAKIDAIRAEVQASAVVAREAQLEAEEQLRNLDSYPRRIVMDGSVSPAQIKAILCQLQGYIAHFSGQSIESVFTSLLLRIEVLTGSEAVSVKIGPNRYCVSIPPETEEDDKRRFVKSQIRDMFDVRPEMRVVLTPGKAEGTTYVAHFEYYVN